MACIDTSTATVVSLETGLGWSVDVTACNLDSNLSEKDFRVIIDNIVQPLSDYTKTSQTLITYSGATSLPANTPVTIFRFSDGQRQFCPTYGDRFQSSQYNLDIDSAYKILNEIRSTLSLGSAAGRIVQVSATDTNPSVLADKIAAGSNISLAILNPGGAEQLQITSVAGGGGGSGDLTAIGLVTTELSLVPQPTASTNAWVAAKGRDAVNDGGEGLFYWDEADTTSTADEGVIYLVQGGAGVGRWKRFREDNFYWDVRWYGVKADGVTDNANALLAMRDTIVNFYNSGMNTIYFPGAPLAYVYSRNTWVRQIRFLTISGYGAKLQNIDASSPWANDRYPLAIASFDSDNLGNRTDDLRAFKSTFPFDDVTAGSRTVTLSNPGDETNFNVGEWCFLGGLIRQAGGSPANLEYFEWHQIIDITGQTLTFRNALLYSYDNRWFGYNVQTINPENIFGSPRIIPEVGDINGTIACEVLELYGVEFLLNPNYAPGSKFNATAWRRNYIKDVNFNNIMYCSFSREIIIEGCTIEDDLEIDKLITTCIVDNCQIGTGGTEAIAAGSGVHTLKITNCDVYGRIRVHPIWQAVIEDNRVMKTDSVGGGAIVHGSSTFTTQLWVANRNVCTTEELTDDLNPVISPFGNGYSLTVDAVGASNEIYIVNDGAGRQETYEQCAPGIIVYNGDDTKRGVIKNIYNVTSPADYIVLENEINAAIVPGDVFYWNTVQNATVSDNSWIQNGLTKKSTDGILFPFQNEGYKIYHVTSENRPFIGSGGSGDEVRAYIERIEFNVTEPYTGAFGGSVDVQFSRIAFAGGPTPPGASRQTIDLKTVGYRSISYLPWECTSTVSSGDQFVPSELNVWAWRLQIRFRQGSGDLVEPDDTLRAKGWYRIWLRNPRGRGASRFFRI